MWRPSGLVLNFSLLSRNGMCWWGAILKHVCLAVVSLNAAIAPPEIHLRQLDDDTGGEGDVGLPLFVLSCILCCLLLAYCTT